MRRQALDQICKEALSNEDIIFVGSDLGQNTLADLKEKRPNQFLMEGVAEAHILTMSAGLASEGKIVFVNSIASFLLRRSFEQLYLDICCENHHVVILGNGGGLVYGPLGHTHTMIDDFSILAGFPNIKILAPADENEMRAAIKYTIDNPGPYYIRVGKGNEPELPPYSDISKVRIFSERKKTKTALMTTGITLHIALEVQKMALQNELSVDIIHKPMLESHFDTDMVDLLSNYKKIIVVEEHMKHGGLRARAQRGVHNEHKVLHFHLGPSALIKEYGKSEELYKYLGLTSENIFNEIKNELYEN